MKAQARDSLGAESAWSGAKTVTITQSTQNAAPTTPATPSGASSALVNAAITFSTSASDPNGDSLQYRFDWGGGVLSGWGAASQSRSWAAAGQYAVKAQARDSIGAESAWSSARTVTITSPAPVVVDTDGDGVPDNQDAFPNDPAEWADANGNGIGDNTDAAQNHPPAAPQVLAPAANAVTILVPTLQTSAFSDPDAGDSHTQTRWQIVQASNSLLVLDVTSTEELTALAVPSLLLDENTEYYWRAIFYDNRGAASEWSQPAWFETDFSLTDANGNGIPDSQEVDSATDLDGNGVNDTEDVNVKAVQTQKERCKGRHRNRAFIRRRHLLHRVHRPGCAGHRCRRRWHQRHASLRAFEFQAGPRQSRRPGRVDGVLLRAGAQEGPVVQVRPGPKAMV